MKIKNWSYLKNIPLHASFILVFLFTFIFITPWLTPVNAQGNLPPGVTPQKIKAVIQKITQTNTDSGVVISSFEAYIEFWNVGELGGDTYKAATVYLTIYHEDEGTSTVTYDLNFSGGPDGTFTLVGGPSVTSGSPGYYTQRDINDQNQIWIPKRMFYEQVDCQATCNLRSGLVDSAWYYFDNCGAFSGWSTGCVDCTAELTWDPNLIPGGVLSPQISYKGPDGQPITVASQALYFNGLEGWSTVWDGSQVNLELQYLCPNNTAHTLKLVVPAADNTIPQQPPSSSAADADNTVPQQPPSISAAFESQPQYNQPAALPPQPENTTQNGPTPKAMGDLAKIVIGGFGIIAVATTIGVVTGAFPGSAGGQAEPASGTEAIDQPQEAPAVEETKKPGLDEKTREALKQKSDQLQTKWQEIRNEITKREQQHLNILRRNCSNRFKSMFRQGMEIKDTITGPVMKVVGEGFKAVSGVDVDKMLFDIDNARDVNILVKGKECQAALKQLIDQLKADLKKTALEKMAIDRQLAGEE